MAEETRAGPPDETIVSHEIFEAAVDLLDPYPWEGPAALLPAQILRANPWLKLPDNARRADIADALRKIVRLYHEWRAADDSAPRVKVVTDKLEAIATCAFDLAEALGSLDEVERQLLLGRFGGYAYEGDRAAHPDLPDHDAWQRLYKAVYPLLDREWGSDGESIPGPPQGASLLRDLGTYVSARLTELRDSEFGLRDRGGATSLHRRIGGTPTWRLVGSAWYLVATAPHRTPSRRDETTLLLIQYLHEAATGEPAEDSRFKRALREFERIWGGYIEKKADFARIWAAYIEKKAKVATLSGSSSATAEAGLPGPPAEDRSARVPAATARALRSILELDDLERQLMRGPRRRS